MCNRGAHLPGIPGPCLSESQRDIKRSEGTEAGGNARPEMDSGRHGEARAILYPPSGSPCVGLTVQAVGKHCPVLNRVWHG